MPRTVFGIQKEKANLIENYFLGGFNYFVHVRWELIRESKEFIVLKAWKRQRNINTRFVSFFEDLIPFLLAK